jgi:hypothetical protein
MAPKTKQGSKAGSGPPSLCSRAGARLLRPAWPAWPLRLEAAQGDEHLRALLGGAWGDIGEIQGRYRGDV